MSEELKQGTSVLMLRLESAQHEEILQRVTQLWQVAIRLPSMPPSSVQDTSELRSIRDFFEAALRAYIKCEDVSGMHQCFEILLSLYQDHSSQLSDSDSQWKIRGLYLTFLLSYNKIEEFHCELESVPWELYTSNQFISFAVTLEQFFMEGNYQEVLLAKPPSSEFNFFVGRISDTIRFEIAASFEKAYQRLSIQSAVQLLRLRTDEDLRIFLNEFSRRIGRDIWKIEGDYLVIKGQENKVHEIPKWQLIDQAIKYAIELERIV
jgi:hypothetical protein